MDCSAAQDYVFHESGNFNTIPIADNLCIEAVKTDSVI